MSNEFMDKYFPSVQEYPNNIGISILPLGEFWSYISSTFLDGFINYMKPLKMYTVLRYGVDVKTRDAVISLNMERDLTHTNISNLSDDDIFILAKPIEISGVKPNNNMFYVFWYDLDCSDCCIGRFVTSDLTEDVIAGFLAWVKDIANDNGYEPIAELDVKLLRGWVSF